MIISISILKFLIVRHLIVGLCLRVFMLKIIFYASIHEPTVGVKFSFLKINLKGNLHIFHLNPYFLFIPSLSYIVHFFN